MKTTTTTFVRHIALLLSILLLLLCGACSLVQSASLPPPIHECVDYCMKERGESMANCQLYCTHGHEFNRRARKSNKAVQVFVDGEPLAKLAAKHRQMETQSDLIANSFRVAESGGFARVVSPNIRVSARITRPYRGFVDANEIIQSPDLEVKSVEARFDRSFYNTPSAFDEVMEFKGELMQLLYHQANTVFVTPGYTYPSGTQLHMLTLPIPVSSEQLNSQDFMNKLLDVVPGGDLEFKTVSPLSFSDAYEDFLLNVKVDAEHLSNVQKTPEQLAKIEEMENKLQQLLNQFMVEATSCQSAYEQHLASNELKAISYTLDQFTPSNAHCVASNQHLDEHKSLSTELANFVKSLNPFDDLFVAIGQQKLSKPDWNYGRSDIEAFRDYHRNMDQQGQTFRNAQFNIPISVWRSVFKTKLFGDTVSTTESSMTASVSFSGLGWQEISVSPKGDWFSMNVIEKYRAKQQVSPKNFFKESGLLSRMPLQVLVAYKPSLKVKISTSMKQQFIQRALSVPSRPFEIGPFVFNRADIRSVWGSNTNEEYEMELTCNLDDPQIFAIKSKPIVPENFPPVPVAPPVQQPPRSGGGFRSGTDTGTRTPATPATPGVRPSRTVGGGFRSGTDTGSRTPATSVERPSRSVGGGGFRSGTDTPATRPSGGRR